MKKTLKSVVDGRMEFVERRLRSDVEIAKRELEPGKRTPKAIMEIVAQIEQKRLANDLERIAKNTAILESASTEVREALGPLLARQYGRGQNDALQRVGEQLDSIGHRLYGRRWIEYDVEELRKNLQAKYQQGGGNGKGK